MAWEQIAAPARALALDLVTVLGGDGTVLKAAACPGLGETPILAFNLGHLGFLTTCEADGLETALERVWEGAARIEARMRLDGTVQRAGKAVWHATALNEFTVNRQALARILTSTFSLIRIW